MQRFRALSTGAEPRLGGSLISKVPEIIQLGALGVFFGRDRIDTASGSTEAVAPSLGRWRWRTSCRRHTAPHHTAGMAVRRESWVAPKSMQSSPAGMIHSHLSAAGWPRRLAVPTLQPESGGARIPCSIFPEAVCSMVAKEAMNRQSDGLGTCAEHAARLWSPLLSATDPAPACGEVPEWSIGTVSKTVVRASVPWVRIPPSPPFQSASGHAKCSRSPS